MSVVPSDIWIIALAAAWAFVPGVALAVALGVRSWVVVLGAAVPVGVALNTVAAEGAALVGVRYSPWSALFVSVLAAAIAVGTRRVLRSRRRVPSPNPATSTTTDDSVFGPERGWAGRVLAWAGGGLLVLAPVIGVATWWGGIGPMSTYNQDHDSIHHQVLTAYIQFTGRAAPWQVIPGDVLTGASPHPYPAGLHRLAALVGAAAGDPVSGLNATLIVLCAIAWTLGAAALTAAVLRTANAAPCWQLAGAGVTALLAAEAYRPVMQYVRDNGVMANAVALALTPGVVAVLLSLRRAVSGATILAGLACAGVVAVHPSSVVSVGITTVAVILGQLTSRTFRRALPDVLRALLPTGAVAAVFAIPTALGALGAAAGTSQYPPTESGVPIARSLGHIVAVPYGGFLDPSDQLNQPVLLVLVCLGLAGTLLLRRGIGITLAWAAWVVISALMYADPLKPPIAFVGAFFYNSASRVVAHVGILVPGLGAFGVLSVAVGARAGAAAAARVLSARRAGTRRKPVGNGLPALVAAGVLTLICLGYALVPSAADATRNAAALGDRWSTPEFDRVNEHDRAAAQFLADNVRPGQRVMNSANDGSTYAYVKYRVPVVNISTLGSDGQPYTYELLESFNTLETNQAIRSEVVDLNIAWVYVDLGAPVIGSPYTPANWYKDPLFVLAPGLNGLATVPELSLAFASGEVSVYRVDLARLRNSPAS